MFGKLKEKIKSWTKKISEEKIEEIIEKPVEEMPIQEETAPVETPKQEKPKEKIQKTKTREVEYQPQEPVKTTAAKEHSPKKQSFLKKLTSDKIIISEKEFEKYSEDLEMLLLENNVAFEVVEKILEKLEKTITNKEIKKTEIESEIKNSLKEIIREILIEPFDLIEEIKNSSEPSVILFCGINGTGKTTTIAKFANLLKKNNLSCILAAADTFRAASIEQIKKHGENLNIKVISNEYGSDPASVGFDAIQYAKKNKIKTVLIDTAGRIHTSKNLLEEIKKIVRVCNPTAKIFVGESITGNDATEQVKSFDEAIDLSGIILSKADIDEKGGTALSVGYTTKKPILYLGTGQEYDKLEEFNPEKFIEKLEL